ncbi:hypothetical protein ISCGN_019614 [Ixodes scapularis]
MDRTRRTRGIVHSAVSRTLTQIDNLLQDENTTELDLRLQLDYLLQKESDLIRLDCDIQTSTSDDDLEAELEGAEEYRLRISHSLTRVRHALDSQVLGCLSIISDLWTTSVTGRLWKIGDHSPVDEGESAQPLHVDKTYYAYDRSTVTSHNHQDSSQLLHIKAPPVPAHFSGHGNHAVAMPNLLPTITQVLGCLCIISDVWTTSVTGRLWKIGDHSPVDQGESAQPLHVDKTYYAYDRSTVTSHNHQDSSQLLHIKAPPVPAHFSGHGNHAVAMPNLLPTITQVLGCLCIISDVWTTSVTGRLWKIGDHSPVNQGESAQPLHVDKTYYAYDRSTVTSHNHQDSSQLLHIKAPPVPAHFSGHGNHAVAMPNLLPTITQVLGCLCIISDVWTTSVTGRLWKIGDHSPVDQGESAQPLHVDKTYYAYDRSTVTSHNHQDSSQLLHIKAPPVPAHFSGHGNHAVAMPNLLPTITQVLGCLCIISDVWTTSVTGRLWKIGDHSPVNQGESAQPLHVDKTYYAYDRSTVTSHNHEDSSQLLHIKAPPVPAHFSGHGNHAVAMPNLLPTITQVLGCLCIISDVWTTSVTGRLWKIGDHSPVDQGESAQPLHVDKTYYAYDRSTVTSHNHQDSSQLLHIKAPPVPAHFSGHGNHAVAMPNLLPTITQVLGCLCIISDVWTTSVTGRLWKIGDHSPVNQGESAQPLHVDKTYYAYDRSTVTSHNHEDSSQLLHIKAPPVPAHFSGHGNHAVLGCLCIISDVWTTSVTGRLWKIGDHSPVDQGESAQPLHVDKTYYAYDRSTVTSHKHQDSSQLLHIKATPVPAHFSGHGNHAVAMPNLLPTITQVLGCLCIISDVWMTSVTGRLWKIGDHSPVDQGESAQPLHVDKTYYAYDRSTVTSHNHQDSSQLLHIKAPPVPAHFSGHGNHAVAMPNLLPTITQVLGCLCIISDVWTTSVTGRLWKIGDHSPVDQGESAQPLHVDKTYYAYDRSTVTSHKHQDSSQLLHIKATPVPAHFSGHGNHAVAMPNLLPTITQVLGCLCIISDVWTTSVTGRLWKIGDHSPVDQGESAQPLHVDKTYYAYDRSTVTSHNHQDSSQLLHIKAPPVPAHFSGHGNHAVAMPNLLPTITQVLGCLSIISDLWTTSVTGRLWKIGDHSPVDEGESAQPLHVDKTYYAYDRSTVTSHNHQDSSQLLHIKAPPVPAHFSGHGNHAVAMPNLLPTITQVLGCLCIISDVWTTSVTGRLWKIGDHSPVDQGESAQPLHVDKTYYAYDRSTVTSHNHQDSSQLLHIKAPPVPAHFSGHGNHAVAMPNLLPTITQVLGCLCIISDVWTTSVTGRLWKIGDHSPVDQGESAQPLHVDKTYYAYDRSTVTSHNHQDSSQLLHIKAPPVPAHFSGHGNHAVAMPNLLPTITQVLGCLCIISDVWTTSVTGRLWKIGDHSPVDQGESAQPLHVDKTYYAYDRSTVTSHNHQDSSQLLHIKAPPVPAHFSGHGNHAVAMPNLLPTITQVLGCLCIISDVWTTSVTGRLWKIGDHSPVDQGESAQPLHVDKTYYAYDRSTVTSHNHQDSSQLLHIKAPPVPAHFSGHGNHAVAMPNLLPTITQVLGCLCIISDVWTTSVTGRLWKIGDHSPVDQGESAQPLHVDKTYYAYDRSTVTSHNHQDSSQLLHIKAPPVPAHFSGHGNHAVAMPNLLPTITQVLGCLCIISDVWTTSVTGRLWKIGDHSPVDQGESAQPLHVDKTYYAYDRSTVTSHNHQDSSQLLHIKAPPVPAHFSGHGNHAVAMPNLLPTITQVLGCLCIISDVWTTSVTGRLWKIGDHSPVDQGESAQPLHVDKTYYAYDRSTVTSHNHQDSSQLLHIKATPVPAHFSGHGNHAVAMPNLLPTITQVLGCLCIISDVWTTSVTGRLWKIGDHSPVDQGESAQPLHVDKTYYAYDRSTVTSHNHQDSSQLLHIKATPVPAHFSGHGNHAVAMPNLLPTITQVLGCLCIISDVRTTSVTGRLWKIGDHSPVDQGESAQPLHVDKTYYAYDRSTVTSHNHQDSSQLLHIKATPVPAHFSGHGNHAVAMPNLLPTITQVLGCLCIISDVRTTSVTGRLWKIGDHSPVDQGESAQPLHVDKTYYAYDRSTVTSHNHQDSSQLLHIKATPVPAHFSGHGNHAVAMPNLLPTITQVLGCLCIISDVRTTSVTGRLWKIGDHSPVDQGESSQPLHVDKTYYAYARSTVTSHNHQDSSQLLHIKATPVPAHFSGHGNHAVAMPNLLPTITQVLGCLCIISDVRTTSVTGRLWKIGDHSPVDQGESAQPLHVDKTYYAYARSTVTSHNHQDSSQLLHIKATPVPAHFSGHGNHAVAMPNLLPTITQVLGCLCIISDVRTTSVTGRLWKIGDHSPVDQGESAQPLHVDKTYYAYDRSTVTSHNHQDSSQLLHIKATPVPAHFSGHGNHAVAMPNLLPTITQVLGCLCIISDVRTTSVTGRLWKIGDHSPVDQGESAQPLHVDKTYYAYARSTVTSHNHQDSSQLLHIKAPPVPAHFSGHGNHAVAMPNLLPTITQVLGCLCIISDVWTTSVTGRLWKIGDHSPVDQGESSQPLHVDKTYYAYARSTVTSHNHQDSSQLLHIKATPVPAHFSGHGNHAVAMPNLLPTITQVLGCLCIISDVWTTSVTGRLWKIGDHSPVDQGESSQPLHVDKTYYAYARSTVTSHNHQDSSQLLHIKATPVPAHFSGHGNHAVAMPNLLPTITQVLGCLCIISDVWTTSVTGRLWKIGDHSPVDQGESAQPLHVDKTYYAYARSTVTSHNHQDSSQLLHIKATPVPAHFSGHGNHAVAMPNLLPTITQVLGCLCIISDVWTTSVTGRLWKIGDHSPVDQGESAQPLHVDKTYYAYARSTVTSHNHQDSSQLLHIKATPVPAHFSGHGNHAVAMPNLLPTITQVLGCLCIISDVWTTSVTGRLWKIGDHSPVDQGESAQPLHVDKTYYAYARSTVTSHNHQDSSQLLHIKATPVPAHFSGHGNHAVAMPNLLPTITQVLGCLCIISDVWTTSVTGRLWKIGDHSPVDQGESAQPLHVDKTYYAYDRSTVTSHNHQDSSQLLHIKATPVPAHFSGHGNHAVAMPNLLPTITQVLGCLCIISDVWTTSVTGRLWKIGDHSPVDQGESAQPLHVDKTYYAYARSTVTSHNHQDSSQLLHIKAPPVPAHFSGHGNHAVAMPNLLPTITQVLGCLCIISDVWTTSVTGRLWKIGDHSPVDQGESAQPLHVDKTYYAYARSTVTSHNHQDSSQLLHIKATPVPAHFSGHGNHAVAMPNLLPTITQVLGCLCIISDVWTTSVTGRLWKIGDHSPVDQGESAQPLHVDKTYYAYARSTVTSHNHQDSSQLLHIKAPPVPAHFSGHGNHAVAMPNLLPTITQVLGCLCIISDVWTTSVTGRLWKIGDHSPVDQGESAQPLHVDKTYYAYARSTVTSHNHQDSSQLLHIKATPVPAHFSGHGNHAVAMPNLLPTITQVLGCLCIISDVWTTSVTGRLWKIGDHSPVDQGESAQPLHVDKTYYAYARSTVTSHNHQDSSQLLHIKATPVPAHFSGHGNHAVAMPNLLPTITQVLGCLCIISDVWTTSVTGRLWKIGDHSPVDQGESAQPLHVDKTYYAYARSTVTSHNHQDSSQLLHIKATPVPAHFSGHGNHAVAMPNLLPTITQVLGCLCIISDVWTTSVTGRLWKIGDHSPVDQGESAQPLHVDKTYYAYARSTVTSHNHQDSSQLLHIKATPVPAHFSGHGNHAVAMPNLLPTITQVLGCLCIISDVWTTSVTGRLWKIGDHSPVDQGESAQPLHVDKTYYAYARSTVTSHNHQDSSQLLHIKATPVPAHFSGHGNHAVAMPNLLPTITQVLGCLCIISDVWTTSVTGRLWKIGDHSPVDQGESAQPLHVDKTYYAYARSTVTSHNHQDSSQLLHIKAPPVPAHFSGHGNHAVAMPNLLPTITQVLGCLCIISDVWTTSVTGRLWKIGDHSPVNQGESAQPLHVDKTYYAHDRSTVTSHKHQDSSQLLHIKATPVPAHFSGHGNHAVAMPNLLPTITQVNKFGFGCLQHRSFSAFKQMVAGVGRLAASLAVGVSVPPQAWQSGSAFHGMQCLCTGIMALWVLRRWMTVLSGLVPCASSSVQLQKHPASEKYTEDAAATAL